MLLFDTSNIKSLLINGLELNTPIPLLPSLEELALRGLFLEAGNGENLTKKLGPLKKLSLRSMNIASEEFFVAFMETIKDNLEELEIEEFLQPKFFKYIFMNLPKLTLLKIDMEVAPDDETFYQQLRANRKIKTLILSDRANNVVISNSDVEGRMQGIIGNLPNVESLRIDFRISKEMMTFISINLSGLRILQTHLNDNFVGVKFPALEEFHIIQVHNKLFDALEAVVESFPNIKKLSLDAVFYSQNFDLKEIFNFNSPEQINIYPFHISKDFVSGILRNCHMLKCLKVVKLMSNYEPTSENSDESIFGPDPRLVFMKNVGNSMIVDFDLWSSEKDHNLFESDYEIDFNDGEFDADDGMDIDEGDDWYDQEEDFFDHEEDSDDEFVGAFRPG